MKGDIIGQYKMDKALYNIGLSPMFKASFVFYFKTVKANGKYKTFYKEIKNVFHVEKKSKYSI